MKKNAWQINYLFLSTKYRGVRRYNALNTTAQSACTSLVGRKEAHEAAGELQCDSTCMSSTLGLGTCYGISISQPRNFFIFMCVSYAEARNRYRLDVCLSVRLSHAGTVSKRLNILS